MANTIRRLADILALINDNTEGAIGAQDHRDAIVSTAQILGHVYEIGNVGATVLSDTSTYVASVATTMVLHDTTSIDGTPDFDMPAQGQLRYLGDITRDFVVDAVVSFTAVANNQELHFRLADNGTTLAPSEVRNKIGTGADIQSVSLQTHVTLAPNGILTLTVKNITTASNITLVNQSIVATGLFS